MNIPLSFACHCALGVQTCTSTYVEPLVTIIYKYVNEPFFKVAMRLYQYDVDAYAKDIYDWIKGMPTTIPTQDYRVFYDNEPPIYLK